jgi:hypothetical protein
MVQLVFFEEKFRQQLADFQLPPDQNQFTGLPREVLELRMGNIGSQYLLHFLLNK